MQKSRTANHSSPRAAAARSVAGPLPVRSPRHLAGEQIDHQIRLRVDLFGRRLVGNSMSAALVTGRSHPRHYRTHAKAFDDIETLYNRRRRHSSLDYLSPAEVIEAKAKAA